MTKVEVVMDSEHIEALKLVLVKSGSVERTGLSPETIGKIIEALVGATVKG